MTKRITISVDAHIDRIKQQILDDIGLDLSYAQVIQFLIKHYMKTKIPASQWRGKDAKT